MEAQPTPVKKSNKRQRDQQAAIAQAERDKQARIEKRLREWDEQQAKERDRPRNKGLDLDR